MTQPTPHPVSERYHGLDALRAAMMFLGLVLHGAASYITLATSAWGFKDRSTSVACDLLVFCIHLFRMPAFFVMAGFFGALLYERRGARQLATNRASRILLPLLVGWPLLYPATVAGFDFAASQEWPTVDAASLGRSGGGGIQMEWVLIHLWFLYYLLIFYVAALGWAAVQRRVPEKWRNSLSGLFRRALASRRRAGLFALPTALTLLPMEMGLLETIPSLTPAPRILLAYGVFFGVGWLLYRERDLLPSLEAGARKCLWGSLGLLPFILGGVAVTVRGDPGDPRLAHGVVVVSGALITWLMIFGLTGLFLRRFRTEQPWVRYLADASYWVYLVHLPLTIWTAGLLAPVALPAPVKFLLVLSATSVLSLLSYDLWVRPSSIGAALNGKRYPRLLGRRDAWKEINKPVPSRQP